MKSPGAKYLQYMFGWHHGAGRQAMDHARSNHEDKDFAALYVQGYMDGQKAGKLASKEASERFGYEPSVIRAI